jgi:hypothetical protein
MSYFSSIDNTSDLPALIMRMQQAGAPQYPLLQALYAGRLAYLPVTRKTSATTVKRWTAAITLPGIATIGDDDHDPLDGPATWPVAARLLKWASLVIIHGTGGHPAHYAAAALTTELHKRVVLIECASKQLDAWKRAVGDHGRNGAMLFTPPPGQSHPSPLPSGVRH